MERFINWSCITRVNYQIHCSQIHGTRGPLARAGMEQVGIRQGMPGWSGQGVLAARMRPAPFCCIHTPAVPCGTSSCCSVSRHSPNSASGALCGPPENPRHFLPGWALQGAHPCTGTWHWHHSHSISLGALGAPATARPAAGRENKHTVPVCSHFQQHSCLQPSHWTAPGTELPMPKTQHSCQGHTCATPPELPRLGWCSDQGLAPPAPQKHSPWAAALG